jgi:beta-1,4-mannosyltransferase
MNAKVTAAHFPTLAALSANPYWVLLEKGLIGSNVQIVDKEPRGFGRRWLLQNRGVASILHFHYVQQFYAYERTQARLRWVLRFGSNLLFARMLGYRTVFTLHNLTPTYPLVPAWVDYLGHWFAARFTNSVIVHCHAAAKALTKRFGRHRGIYVVSHPNYIGVYPGTVDRDGARAQLGLLPDQTVFLFFGGLRPNKGIDHLINSFRQLPGEHLILLIAGQPWPPESYIEDLRQLASADSRIRCINRFIPDDEVAVYMAAADSVILPFARILTSSSVILAMSFARPVVAPAMGCLPELITKNNGLLYDPNDPDGLKKALFQIRDADLHALGRCARETVQPLTVKRFGAETLSAYTKQSSVRLW